MATSILVWVIILWLVLRLLRSRPLPSRETIVKPDEERVLLLGASSGVGRDLAHAYACRNARICLVARNETLLQAVKQECVDLGMDESKVIFSPGDITSTDDLLRIRQRLADAWGGVDTVHILAGVPSTQTLLDIAEVPLSDPRPASATNPLQRRTFWAADESSDSFVSPSSLPTEKGLDRVAREARACGEVNYVGTVLALACFLPMLSFTSRSPVLHHLSSVAATIPAPCRAIYSATKAAAFIAVESCRVECEGSGVRFFSLLPGTIANGFRLKHALDQTGGRDETTLPIRHSWEKLLLDPDEVVSAILDNLSLNPAPAPLIPYFPLSLIPALRAPPKAVIHLPKMYYWATLMSWTPLGWGYVEPSARKKYGLPP